MISPKEKAQDIFNKMLFCYQGHIDEYTAKQCALVAVDVVLSTIVSTPTDYGASWTYWMQVKQEIEKL
jgi:hypothetical protein